MAINWKDIRAVWDVGHDNLQSVAAANGITMPEVALKAQQEGWPPRGSMFDVPESGPTVNIVFKESVLTDVQVTLAHKTDLGRLRLVSAAVMETLQYNNNPVEVLKIAERVAKIYSILIPLERKVCGIETDNEGMPDGITISVKK